jgi:hypothetical protein
MRLSVNSIWATPDKRDLVVATYHIKLKVYLLGSTKSHLKHRSGVRYMLQSTHFASFYLTSVSSFYE